ncbi:hypothetical protein [Winogradskyella wichelsiae]|uniref:hypothetical protein n=1 Tax=Winogradskyella wichelsiae TaxID=2697007 RepID=UPI0015C97562|nr:hypothetical protein [Winogradskyella wichelsiae]
MKNTFNKYLTLVVVLLLSTFANLQANDTNNLANNTAIHNLCVQESIADQLGDNFLRSKTITPIHHNSDHRRNVEIIESNNLEDEEASTKKLYYKDILEIAFINALVFEHASNYLQKSIYRPQSAINEPSLRLHIQFQVFII